MNETKSLAVLDRSELSDRESVIFALERAKQIIADSDDVGLLAKGKQQAEAAAAYVRARDLGLDVSNLAREVALRCVRRLGELVSRKDLVEVLGSNGATTAKRLAAVDQALFDVAMTERRNKRGELTMALIVREFGLSHNGAGMHQLRHVNEMHSDARLRLHIKYLNTRFRTFVDQWTDGTEMGPELHRMTDDLTAGLALLLDEITVTEAAS